MESRGQNCSKRVPGRLPEQTLGQRQMLGGRSIKSGSKLAENDPRTPLSGLRDEASGGASACPEQIRFMQHRVRFRCEERGPSNSPCGVAARPSPPLRSSRDQRCRQDGEISGTADRACKFPRVTPAVLLRLVRLKTACTSRPELIDCREMFGAEAGASRGRCGARAGALKLANGAVRLLGDEIGNCRGWPAKSEAI